MGDRANEEFINNLLANNEEQRRIIEEQRHIIEENNRKLFVSEAELLKIDLTGYLIYSERAHSAQTGPGNGRKIPKDVYLWSEFTDGYFNQPFNETVIYESVVIDRNVHINCETDLSRYICSLCYTCFESAIFKEREHVFLSQFRMKLGVSDIVYAIPLKENKDYDVLLIFEIKTKWVLDPSTSDIGSHYDSLDVNTRNSIGQLYSYLIRNKRKYGVLSTFENSWFFKVDDKKALYISNVIKPKDFLQAMKHVLDLSTTECILNISSSSSSSDSTGVSDNAEDLNKPKCQGDKSSESDSTERPEYLPPDKRAKGTSKLDQRSKKSTITGEIINELLDDGISLSCNSYHSVIKIEIEGVFYKVKLLDISKQDTSSLENESKIYKHLTTNKASGIPEIVFEGILDGLFYVLCIGFLEGEVLKFKEMSKEIRMNCVQALQLLHDNNVLHNDIREENFIVQPNGTCCVIDYHLSKISHKKCRFEEEMHRLKHLLELN